MQRYATSVAGQTCSYSDKAAKRGDQYLYLDENVSIVTTKLGNSVVLIRHHWHNRQAALGKIAMKMCGQQQVCVT